jgi:hypothetical protein
VTVYRKCRPCKHRGDCEIQKKIGEAIRGLGVSSLMHKCKNFKPFLERGAHVTVRVAACRGEWEYGGTAPLAEFDAIFIGLANSMGRAIVYIEPGAKSACGKYEFEPLKNDRGFCKVSFGPLSARHAYSRTKGIIARREGKTALRDCCDIPLDKVCGQCGEADKITEEAFRI